MTVQKTTREAAAYRVVRVFHIPAGTYYTSFRLMVHRIVGSTSRWQDFAYPVLTYIVGICRYYQALRSREGRRDEKHSLLSFCILSIC